MSESRKVIVSAPEYIEKLAKGTMEKILLEDEELCPYCQGTGLELYENKEAEEYIPNVLRSFKTFVVHCSHCFNGVVKKCEYCGELLPIIGEHKCDGVASQIMKSRIDWYKQFIDTAYAVPLTEAPTHLFSEYLSGDGIFSDWEAFFKNYNREIDERPDYVWGTKKVFPTMDAYTIAEDSVVDMYTDAISDIPEEKIDELQAYLDNWCSNCGVQDFYEPDFSIKVRIPWEQYISEE